jgi:hypothetical protein
MTALTSAERQRRYRQRRGEGALPGHRHDRTRYSVEVLCECGWVSCVYHGQGARREAYAEWRRHKRRVARGEEFATDNVHLTQGQQRMMDRALRRSFTPRGEEERT